MAGGSDPLLHNDVVKRYMCVLGVPETTLRFDDLPRGLTEPRKAVVFRVIADYRERMNTEISKGKRCIWESRRSQKGASDCPVPVELYPKPFVLPAMTCDHV